MEQYTLQEIFNKIWKRFVIEKSYPSYRFSSSTPGLFLPMYKINDNVKCFIGILIPDDCYKMAFEGKNVDYLLKEPKIDHIFKNIDINKLKTLQKIHDWSIEAEIYGSNFYKEIEKRLIDFAKNNSLSTNL